MWDLIEWISSVGISYQMNSKHCWHAGNGLGETVIKNTPSLLCLLALIPASPPCHFLSPLPSAHIGCQSCLSQFFLAGRQDTDIAASGLCGTNVRVYFPAPTIILPDIWWQSHLEWWHENKHESRWEFNCDCWIFLRYAQDTWMRCMSLWFTQRRWMPSNWWCKSLNLTLVIISAAFTTSDCSCSNFLRLKKHSTASFCIAECAAPMAVQWKTCVFIWNCRDLDLWSSYFLFYFVVPIPMCCVLFLAAVVHSLLWSPWFASPASALSLPKHPVLVLVTFPVFVYFPALSVLFLWSTSRSTLVYLSPCHTLSLCWLVFL